MLTVVSYLGSLMCYFVPLVVLCCLVIYCPRIVLLYSLIGRIGLPCLGALIVVLSPLCYSCVLPYYHCCIRPVLCFCTALLAALHCLVFPCLAVSCLAWAPLSLFCRLYCIALCSRIAIVVFSLYCAIVVSYCLALLCRVLTGFLYILLYLTAPHRPVFLSNTS